MISDRYQRHLSISSVVSDCREVMILQAIMQLSIAHTNRWYIDVGVLNYFAVFGIIV